VKNSKSLPVGSRVKRETVAGVARGDSYLSLGDTAGEPWDGQMRCRPVETECPQGVRRACIIVINNIMRGLQVTLGVARRA